MSSKRIRLIVLAALLAVPGHAQEKTGTVSQPLVGGRVLSPDQQELLTLLTLQFPGGSCSASLLTNDWAITAAHCVESGGATVAAPTVTLTAQWPTVQVKPATRIVSFRPRDVAILQVGTPFSVNGSTTSVDREIFGADEFPYWGSFGGVPISSYGRGISQFAQGSGASATPSSSDGFFRVGFFRIALADSNETQYTFPREPGQSMAGGDSGGPSFTTLPRGRLLVGVHSRCTIECVDGKTCGNGDWSWVTGTPQCTDATIKGLTAQIWSIIGRSDSRPVTPPERTEPWPMFGTTPPNLEPIWVYAIAPAGDLLWYRKDNAAAAWKGPLRVGTGWAGFTDVIPAGGNHFYALTPTGELLWYRHDGFSDGRPIWKGPVSVGAQWHTALRIFAGGEGIVYRIMPDGQLVWFKNADFREGVRAWAPERVVGSGWQNFRHVFSTGKGTIYAVRPDGVLVRYQHSGYLTGANTWSGPRTIGGGWDQYLKVVPVGGDVVLAVRTDGRLFWYKLARAGLTVGDASGRIQNFEGPVEVGTGWEIFRNVIGLMPADASVVR